MAHRIAIVEDEPAIAANYRDALLRKGYQVAVYPDRPSASIAFAAGLPDLAIIDIGLGDEVDGGFELCRELRARCQHTPIVFLTARDAEIDHISGLRLGADDYISKDESINITVEHIAVLLRRTAALRAPQKHGDIVTSGELQLNTERLTATWRGQDVKLTASTEFPMVLALARRPGQVKSRQQLMDAANTLVEEPSVSSHIRRIRRKFQQADPGFDAIETVYGAGYRWLV
jgi:two-component system OmpR family response regulator